MTSGFKAGVRITMQHSENSMIKLKVCWQSLKPRVPRSLQERTIQIPTAIRVSVYMMN